MEAEDQQQAIARIDELSRRALESGEDADVERIVGMYEQAIDDCEAIAAKYLARLEVEPENQRFLTFKIEVEEGLREALKRRIEDLRNGSTASLRQSIVRSANEQFYWDAYMIDMATPPGIEVETSRSPDQTAEAIANTPWEGGMFSNKVWAITDDLLNEMQNEISAGVSLGEGVDQIVRRIRHLDVLDKNVPPAYAMERLVRTEVMSAADRSRDALYQLNDDIVDGEQIVETIDGRTDEGCGALDGLELDSDEAQAVIDEEDFNERPPFHPNCRGTTIPKLKSWKELLGLDAPDDIEDFGLTDRVVRGEDGKSILAPMVSFEEWMKQRGIG